MRSKNVNKLFSKIILQQLIIVIGLILIYHGCSFAQSVGFQGEDWHYFDPPIIYLAIDYAPVNADTILVLSKIYTESGDSIVVHVTKDQYKTYQEVFSFPASWGYGSIYSSESWGIVIRKPNPWDTITNCSKYHIVFDQLGSEWRYLDNENLSGCSTEIHFISKDTAYFLSYNSNKQQVIGIIWSKGDSVKVLRTFNKNSTTPFQDLVAFNDGVVYAVRNDTLFKTYDNFKTINLVTTRVNSYVFTNSKEGAVLRYNGTTLFIHGDSLNLVPISCLFNPLTSNLVQVNNHSVSYTISWGGTSGGVWLSTGIEDAQCYTSTIHYQGYGQLWWKLYHPYDSVLFGFSSHTIIKSKSIGDVTHYHNITTNSSFNIFPNPCKDELYLEIHQPQRTTFIVKVLDVTGRTLERIDFNIESEKSQFKIETYDLVSGLFFLYIEDQKTQLKKVMPFIKMD